MRKFKFKTDYSDLDVDHIVKEVYAAEAEDRTRLAAIVRKSRKSN